VKPIYFANTARLYLGCIHICTNLKGPGIVK